MFSLENKVLKLIRVCDTVIIIIVVLTADKSQIEEIDAAQSTSAQATDLGTCRC